jgi:hypothetical protein
VIKKSDKKIFPSAPAIALETASLIAFKIFRVWVGTTVPLERFQFA